MVSATIKCWHKRLQTMPARKGEVSTSSQSVRALDPAACSFCFSRGLVYQGAATLAAAYLAQVCCSLGLPVPNWAMV